MSFKLLIVGKLSPVQVSRHLENVLFFLIRRVADLFLPPTGANRLEGSTLTKFGRGRERGARHPARCGALRAMLAGDSLGRPQPTRCGEVSLRESAHSILSNTESAPSPRSNTLRTVETLSEPAKTFTAESGMVNLPYYHSFVHVDHFFRG